jgi:hypothetical protein
MDLLVVISMEFLIQDHLGIFNLPDIFSNTGSYQSILEPAVGSFNFALGLRGKGMDDFYIAVFQNLFPLRSGLIGQEVVFSPERVFSLDESEDSMRIHIISVRESIVKDDTLEGENMGPAGFSLNQSCIEEESTVVIQGGNKVPFLLGGWSPEMIGGIMLNQLSGIIG